MNLSPRILAMGGAALAAVLVLAAILTRLSGAPDLAFAERTDPPGFRNLVFAGAAEARADETTPLPPWDPNTPPAARPGDICAALFEDDEDPRLGAGAPQVVYFSDYRCPVCRVMGKMLIERAQAGDIALVFKEWPVLGPQSETAARAALAAARQGGFLRTHERLTAMPFVPNAAYARDLARGQGLDADRLIADFEGAEVADQLARTQALAGALGFGGVPGLVVGRTIVLRSLDEERLDALLAAERALGPPPC